MTGAARLLGPEMIRKVIARLANGLPWSSTKLPTTVANPPTSAVADAIVGALSTPLSPAVGTDLGGRTTAVARLTSHLESWPKLELEPVGT